MKVPLSWLKEYVEIKVPADELARRLTMAGTEVAEVATIGGWNNCFVGYVAEVEPHPNADRLTLCTVELEEERAQVVCGAPNVAAGQKIAFARVGAELYDRHSQKVEPLKAAKIRGVVSEGMICSELELGIGEDHQGILVLPEDAPLGTPLADYLGDSILDLEVTPNRPDCLSVLGVAHEVAALTDAMVREPDSSYPEDGQPIESLVSVEVADPDLCPRYTASLVTGITVGPSPVWLQDRLLKVGMRPINNVVDITNYVMLEYNQPMHAFDFDTVKERKIVVRRAKPGEMTVSLDGVERKLSPETLVIADADDPVGLAGVIGGACSEITEKSTSVFLESATFNPINNRRTAQALKLSTEASIRFEKGLRPELAPIALRRATQLIQEIAGGAVAKGTIDIFPGSEQYSTPVVTLTLDRVQKVLGMSPPLARIEEVLESLGFTCERADSGVRVEVPYWRSDISIEDDLVEEVARIVGYDDVPTTLLSTPIPYHRPQPLLELREQVRDLLVACGMEEVISYSVTSLDELEKARALRNGEEPLKLANPMSSQQQYLRPTLRGSLMSTLAANQLHELGPIAIFEVGRTYHPRADALPEEREIAAGVFLGPRQEEHWLTTEEELGYHDAQGVVQKVLEELGAIGAYDPDEDPFLHPGKCARVFINGTRVAKIGEVHPRVVEVFGIDRGPVAFFELELENLLTELPDGARRYTPVGRFPAATRDVAVLVDDSVPAAKVHGIMEQQPLVVKVTLFDVYVGDNIPAGKRSLAYHVHFQSQSRTLTADEVTQAHQAVLSALQREVSAELRGQDNG